MILDFELFEKDEIWFHISNGLVQEILLDYDKQIDNIGKKYDIDAKYIGYWDNTSFHLGLRINYNLNDFFYLMTEPNLNYLILMNEHRRFYYYGIEFSLGCGF